MEKVSEVLDALGWCWCVRRTPSLPGINTRVPVFCIMGPTGCGKTTLAHYLAKQTNFSLIDVKKIIKGEINVSIFKDEDIIPDEIYIVGIQAVMNIIKYDVPGFILDDFPRNLHQIKLFKSEIYEPRLIIYINLKIDDYLKRVSNKQQYSEAIARKTHENETNILNEVYRNFETKTIKVFSDVPASSLSKRLVLYLETYYGFRFEQDLKK